ncbi:MAG: glycosyltransferase, partial [bacterium]
LAHPPGSPWSGAERTIRILADRFPDLAGKLNEHLRTRRKVEAGNLPVSVQSVGSGEWAVRYSDSSGAHWLHPSVSPRQAALRVWENVQFPARGLVVVWNTGIGYALEALKGFVARKELETRVILCEEQFDLVWESLNIYDWVPFLVDQRVCVFWGADSGEELLALLDRYQSLLLHECVLIPGRNLLPSEQENLAYTLKRIKEIKQNAVPPSPGAPDRKSWVIGSRSLAEMADALVSQADLLSIKMMVADRTAGMKRFFPSVNAWLETCHGVTPGYHIATYTSLFSDRELHAMGEAGTHRILWFWDRAAPAAARNENAECYDLVLVCEQSDVDALPQMGYRNVKRLHAATGFSHWSPSTTTPPADFGTPQVAYVGATGYRLAFPELSKHPQASEILMDAVRSTVEKWQGGDAAALQSDLTIVATEHATLWGENALRLTFQLATAEIRKEFLTAAIPHGLVIYGDAIWGDSRYSGPLASVYAGRSLDYPTETPHVYHRATINLNIVHSSLLDTVAFRVFDVLACGGFLLTEYRPIFEELFEPGVHLDIFRDSQELVEKIEYYLAHDEIRQRIAQAGREKVLAEHTFASRLTQIIKWLEVSP